MNLVETALRFTLLGIGVWIAAVWLAGLIYIAVTYLEAIRHVPQRSASMALRSVLREAWCIMWSQPLLPLFQVAVRHMGSGGGEVPIVMVHGYFQNRVDFLYLAKRLRAQGCGPLYACNFFWPQSLEKSTNTIRSFVEGVMEETGASQVDLLTHSSGGLLGLDLLASHPEWVRRAAVIAIPWRGVTWKGPVLGHSGSQLRADSLYTLNRPQEIVGGPVLSVFSVHDNLVHPPETSRITGSDVTVHEVENLGHLAVLFDPEVADVTCDFLLAEEPTTA